MRFTFLFLALALLGNSLVAQQKFTYAGAWALANARAGKKFPPNEGIFTLGPEQSEETELKPGVENKRTLPYCRSFSILQSPTMETLLRQIPLQPHTPYQVLLYRPESPIPVLQLSGKPQSLVLSQFPLEAADILVITLLPK